MSHYFSEKQESALQPKEFSYSIHGNTFSFITGSGVFSKDHVDKGTHVLVKYMQLPSSGKVLDLGCGYGVVGIVAARIGSCEVVCSDVNERAVMLCKKNVKKNHVDVQVVKCSLFSKLDKFDCILTNPPYVKGREFIFQLLEESYSHLNSKGSLQVVARHNKGGKVLRDKMEELFDNVEDVGRGSGFHLYVSRKL